MYLHLKMFRYLYGQKIDKNTKKTILQCMEDLGIWVVCNLILTEIAKYRVIHFVVGTLKGILN